MTKENFRLLLDIWISLDPFPVPGKFQEWEKFLTAKARDFGFQDHIEAYHNLKDI